MALPKDARKLTRDLFRASFSDGRLDANKVRTIAQKVIDTKPRHYADILGAYQRLVRLEQEKHHATIESAADLDQGTREQLEKSLRARYGNDLTTDFKVNSALLGGLRIKVGSDVFDSTVRERLNRLETQLATA